MIKITKDEATMLRKELPEVFIVTVGRKAPARKKTRFVEETREVIRLVDKYRKTYFREVAHYGE